MVNKKVFFFINLLDYFYRVFVRFHTTFLFVVPFSTRFTRTCTFLDMLCCGNFSIVLYGKERIKKKIDYFIIIRILIISMGNKHVKQTILLHWVFYSTMDVILCSFLFKEFVWQSFCNLETHGKP